MGKTPHRWGLSVITSASPAKEAARDPKPQKPIDLAKVPQGPQKQTRKYRGQSGASQRGGWSGGRENGAKG